MRQILHEISALRHARRPSRSASVPRPSAAEAARLLLGANERRWSGRSPQGPPVRGGGQGGEGGLCCGARGGALHARVRARVSSVCAGCDGGRRLTARPPTLPGSTGPATWSPPRSAGSSRTFRSGRRSPHSASSGRQASGESSTCARCTTRTAAPSRPSRRRPPGSTRGGNERGGARDQRRGPARVVCTAVASREFIGTLRLPPALPVSLLSLSPLVLTACRAEGRAFRKKRRPAL